MDVSSLLQFFSEDMFLDDLKSHERDEVLQELVKPLVDSGKIRHANRLIDVLRQREILGSTAIVKHVAIPHCRTLNSSDTHIVVGLSEEGVDFNAGDGKSVKLFFLIVAPPQEKENMYLPILGHLCEILRNSKKHKALLKVKTYESLIEILKG